VRVKLAFDVALELRKAFARQSNVLAQVLDLQLVRLGVVAADLIFSSLDQSRSQAFAVAMAIETQPRQGFGTCGLEGVSRGITRQNRRGQFTFESTHMVLELRES
jgi:hypothetical protein